MKSLNFRTVCLYTLIFLLTCSPAQAALVKIEVRVDERVSDWCARLEYRQLWSCSSIRRALQKSDFDRYAFLGEKNMGLRRLEGALRPGKYTTKRKLSASAMLQHLLHKAQNAYRLTNRHGLSARQQMILASIVEKEAASNKDYANVARVFLNRLNKNQQLGSCPTVEYALGYHRPFLLFKDLEIQSPYNVYKRKGLPPTPIAFFSDAALDGVRNPAPGKNYFFVYDWTTGKLHFTPEYQIHKRNAKRARQNFIQRYGRDQMYRKFPGKYYEAID